MCVKEREREGESKEGSKEERKKGSYNSLHDMLQRMALRLLKIITPVYRIEPRVQKVLRPIPIPHNDTRGHQSLFILRHHEVDPVALQVPKRFDHAVGGHNGFIGEHDVFEARGLEHVRLEVERGVHDERAGVEIPEVGGAGEERHGVAEGGDLGPGAGGGVDGVLGVGGEEGEVACGELDGRSIQPCIFSM